MVAAVLGHGREASLKKVSERRILPCTRQYFMNGPERSWTGRRDSGGGHYLRCRHHSWCGHDSWCGRHLWKGRICEGAAFVKGPPFVRWPLFLPCLFRPFLCVSALPQLGEW